MVASKDGMVNLFKSKSCGGIPFKQRSLGVAVEFGVVTKCNSSAFGELGQPCPPHVWEAF